MPDGYHAGVSEALAHPRVLGLFYTSVVCLLICTTGWWLFGGCIRVCG